MLAWQVEWQSFVRYALLLLGRVRGQGQGRALLRVWLRKKGGADNGDNSNNKGVFPLSLHFQPAVQMICSLTVGDGDLTVGIS